MIQVINNEIIQTHLPSTGTLSDGRSVSNYNCLPNDILIAEGWLPLEDNPPLYDVNTQELQHNGYDIQPDKVIKLYNIVDKPEPQPTELEQLQQIVADIAEELLAL